MIAQAIAFAAGIHEKQYDKGGDPYILHCIRVMQKTRDKIIDLDNVTEAGGINIPVAAVLHDTIEDDKKYTRAALEKMIYDQFGDSALYLVQALTREPGMSYLGEYIPGLLVHEEAEALTIIKLADLEDNLNPLRQPTLGDKDLQRLQKYHMAYRMLRGE